MSKEKKSPQEESVVQLKRAILMAIHPDKWQGWQQQLFANTIATKSIITLQKNPVGILDLPIELRLWSLSNAGAPVLHIFDISKIISANYIDRVSMVENLFRDINEKILNSKKESLEERKAALRKQYFFYKRQKLLAQALPYMEALVELDPYDLNNELNITHLEFGYSELQMFEELGRLYQKMKSMNISPMQWDFMWGNSLSSRGKYKDAIDFYNMQLNSNSRLGLEHLNNDIFVGLAEAYASLGDFAKREEYYLLAVKAAKARIDRTKNGGNFKKEDFDNEEDYLRATIDFVFETDLVDCTAEIAGYFLKIGKINEALDVYRDAIEMYKVSNSESTLAGYYNGFGILYFRVGKFDQALEMFILASKTNPDRTTYRENVEVTKKKLRSMGREVK